MKFFALTLVAMASAQDAVFDFEDDMTNNLRVRWGQAARADVKAKAKVLKGQLDAMKASPFGQRFAARFQHWSHSEQVAHIKQVDAAFMRSPAGQRLVREWKQFGAAVKANVHPLPRGHGFQVDNEALEHIKDEGDDVVAEYKPLFNHNAGWGKRFYVAWKAALSTDDARSLHRSLQAFKKSETGQRFKGNVKALLRAVKEGAQVTDKPTEQFEEGELDLDEEEFESLLHISIREGGKVLIKGRAIRAKFAVKRMMQTEEGQTVKEKFQNWAGTPQVQKFRFLQKKFMQSDEGRELIGQWRELGQALKEAVVKTPRGLFINNDDLRDIAHDEGRTVFEHEKRLWSGQGVYGAAFKRAGGEVVRAPATGEFKEAVKALSQTPGAQHARHEVKNLRDTLKEQVQVRDIPDRDDFDDFDTENEEFIFQV